MVAMSFLLGTPLPMQAQAANGQALPPLRTVAVTGSTRYGQPELIQATGLKTGQALTVESLHEAGKRLRATGMFDSINFRYTYNGQGTNAIFEITDTQDLLPVEFDNFVWMPRDQLMQRLRSQVPLFTGELPLSGSVNDGVSNVLQGILQQRGVNGATVEGIPYQAQIGMKGFSGYVYHVEGIKIPITQVEFIGASPELLPVFNKDAASLIGENYSRAVLEGFADGTLLPEFQNRGFLQARVDPPTAQLSDPASNSVRVSLAVTPGALYHWATIACQGNSAVTAAKLAALIKSRPGDLADRSALDRDVAAVQSLYAHTGYLDAAVTPHLDLSQAGIAGVTLAIIEGPQYTMGRLSFQGVSSDSVVKLNKLWTLAAGQPFDSSYLRQFVTAAFRQFDLRGFKVQPKVMPDRQRHVVDVQIGFVRAAPGGGQP